MARVLPSKIARLIRLAENIHSRGKWLPSGRGIFVQAHQTPIFTAVTGFIDGRSRTESDALEDAKFICAMKENWLSMLGVVSAAQKVLESSKSSEEGYKVPKEVLTELLGAYDDFIARK